MVEEAEPALAGGLREQAAILASAWADGEMLAVGARLLAIAALVLHINREVIHHGAEVALLRDLYRSRQE